MIKLISKVIIVFVVLFTVVFIWLASNLKFDYNFESFFPVNDPDLKEFNDFRERFEPDNDYLLLSIENEGGVFEKKFLQNINKLTDSIKKINLIEDVISPTQIKYTVLGGLVPTQIPYLHWENPELYIQDSIKIYSSKELVGTFFSNKVSAITIYIKTVYEPSKIKSDLIVNQIEDELLQFEFKKYHLVGKVKAQKVYLEKMEYEILFFLLLSALLVIVFLFLTYRSFIATALPLLLVLFSLSWIFGVMKLTGKSIDLMMTLLPTIMFVVGISDVIHLYTKFIDELRKGFNKLDALKIAIKEIGLATLLTTLTTAIGFLTLSMSGVLPIKEFGIYMAIGVIIAYVLSFTLFPAVLLNLSIPKLSYNHSYSMFWNRLLSRILIWTINNIKRIIISTIVLVFISFIGISKVKVNNYLLEDLDNKHPLKQDFVFFETNFSGVRPFELTIKLLDSTKSILDYQVMKEISKLEKYLNTQYGVGFIFSPLTPVKTINKALNAGNNDYYRLPDNEVEYQKLKDLITKNRKRKELKLYVSDDHLSGRISGKMSDLGSYEVTRLNKELIKYINSNIKGKYLDIKLTGSAHLIDKNNNYLATNMLQGLLIALSVVSLIVGILFRSFRMIGVALIVNIIPLLLIGGVMGFFELDLKISTSIIFTIAFGIAVDDTIHFLSKLKHEIRKGKNLFYSIKRTFLSTGKAIIITSFILCGGFITLISSDFSSTFYVGLLISLTLFLALLSDLILLPILLILFYNKNGNES